ncbi:hypothetical protein NUU61_008175 [Penicillium alfredii]|uniref:Uncharacterized protein n=1 Tax=Penicillium alfredii TaxID=1506179 RepID=A0A9W9ERW0_9EURO|nr:uncharacterized protein NUU61_008175 [Penicillium alfredii]KAJ5086868.1 hypothetical protein NUU61_008175 [Penicillium alfredii]
MKSPPQPATVHELKEDSSPMLHSKVSATRNRVTRRNAILYSLNRAQHRPRKAPDCSDEDINLGKRDLRLRIVSESLNSTYLEQESYDNYLRGHTIWYGYYIKDYVYLDEGSIFKSLQHIV